MALLLGLLLLGARVPTTAYAAEVPEITITFDEPVAGASAATAPTLVCKQGYEIDWTDYREVSDTTKEFTGTFENDHAYVASMNLYLPSGDTLSQDCNITINGTRLSPMLGVELENLSTYMNMELGDFSGVMLTFMFTLPATGNDTAGTTENTVDGDNTSATTESAADGSASATTESTDSGNDSATTEDKSSTTEKTADSSSTDTETPTGNAVVSEVTVTFQEPEAGTSAAVCPTPVCSQGYEVTWADYREVSDTEKIFTGTFENNHVYIASMDLTLPVGSSFAQDCSFTVNGTKLSPMIGVELDSLSTYLTIDMGDAPAAKLTYMFTLPSTQNDPGSTTGTTGTTEPPVSDGKTTPVTETPADGKTTATTESSSGSQTIPTIGSVTDDKTESAAEAAVSTKTSLKVKASKTSLKRSAKKQTVKLTVTTNSNGKVSYSAASNSKKLKKYVSVNKKGVITFKKNAPKGTYKIKVTVAAKDDFKSASKTIKIKIK